uniref:B30.2/SPRY domain-containing protein n=1 Tax=Scleropages formosus TaxID=113540 RepID=A0A8C9QVF3_SCLFO
TLIITLIHSLTTFHQNTLFSCLKWNNKVFMLTIHSKDEGFYKTGRLQCFCEIKDCFCFYSLSPVDTAHHSLILSEDRKQVRDGDTKQDLPDNPERFNPVVSVLGKEGFSSGRHYWEVQVGDKTDWALGVARESVNRKGKNSLSPNNGYWTILLNNGNEYKALADSSVSINLSVKPQKVGVYVDYEEGQVSFYSVETRSHIYTFTGYKFTEKLYPYFSPFLSNNGTNSGPLIITSVSPIA